MRRVIIEFPPTGVEVATRFLERSAPAFDLLIAGGEVGGGPHDARNRMLALYRRLRDESARQVAAAARSGQLNVTVTSTIPANDARDLMNLARELVRAASDEATMRRLGTEPLTPEDLAYVEPYMSYAEAAISRVS